MTELILQLANAFLAFNVSEYLFNFPVNDILIFSLVMPLMVMTIGVAIMLKHPKLGYRIAFVSAIIEAIAFGVSLILWQS